MNQEITPGYVFSDGEPITYDGLNQLVAEATLSNVSQEKFNGLVNAVARQADAATVTAALERKSDIGHTHTVDEIESLRDALEKPHGHAMTKVAGLADALANKSGTTHTHNVSDVCELTEAIDNINMQVAKAMAKMADVRNVLEDKAIERELSTKADVTHGHVGMRDINAIDGALSGLAAAQHAHDLMDVKDAADVVRNKAEHDHKHGVGAIPEIKNRGLKRVDTRDCLTFTEKQDWYGQPFYKQWSIGAFMQQGVLTMDDLRVLLKFLVDNHGIAQA